MNRFLRKTLLMLGLLVLSWVMAGCQTAEPDNASSRPWNTPRGWEHGLPSGINEGR